MAEQVGWQALTPMERSFLARLCLPYLRPGAAKHESYAEISVALNTTGAYLKQVAHDLYNKLAVADRSRQGLANHALISFRRELMAASAERARRRSSRPSSLVGRHGELRAIHRAMASHQTVVVTGPAGVGKSRLVREAIERIENVPSELYVIELDGVADSAEVAPLVGLALGARQGGNTPDTIATSLSDRPVLLALDGCDGVIEGCAALIERVARSCPNLRVIATSRETLGVADECVLAVPPLPVPDLRRAVQALGANESVRLFCERAEAADSSFSPGDRNLRPIARICARLDGLPLGIELAAAHVGHLALGDIERHLDDLLRTTDPSQPTRRQPLTAAIAWSYEQLSDAEATVLRHIAIFPTSFTLDSATAVTRDSSRLEGGERQVAAALSALVRRSLVLRVDNTSRYRILGPIRQLMLQRLDDNADEAEHAFTRLVRWAVSHTDRWIDGRSVPSADTDMDYENVIQVLRESCDRGLVAEAIQLVRNLSEYWTGRGLSEDGLRYAEMVINDDRSGRSDGSPARATAAELAWHLGDLDRASSQFEGAMTTAQPDDFTTRGRCLIGLGNVSWTKGDLEACVHHWQAARDLYERAGSEAGVGRAEMNLANAAFYQGDMEKAATLARHAKSQLLAAGDLDHAATATMVLGNIAIGTQDYGEAIHQLEETLHAREQLQDLSGQADCLSNLGAAHYFQGNLNEAESAWEESLALRLRTGESWGEVASRTNLATVANARGRYGVAVDHLLRSFEMLEKMDAEMGLPDVLELSAATAAGLGRRQEGATLYGAAREIRERMNLPLLEPDRIRVTEEIDGLREVLGARSFRAAYDAGRKLTTEGAIAAARFALNAA